MAIAKWIQFGATPQPAPAEEAKVPPLPIVSAEGKHFGLENFGNTCYANSVLQALYFCAPFRELIIQTTPATDDPVLPPAPPSPASLPPAAQPQPVRRKSERRDTRHGGDAPHALPGAAANGVANGAVGALTPPVPPSLYAALRALFVQIARNPADRGTLAPRAFIDKLKELNEAFRGTMHQDAHEFLNYLLNQIVEEMDDDRRKRPSTGAAGTPAELEDLSTSIATLASTAASTIATAAATSTTGTIPSASEATIVHRLFEGVLTSETRCLTCETVSSRDEAFLDLSIDIEPNASVTACLRQFSASEMLCQKNKFFCDACCDLQEAEKRMKIKKLPNVLALHLKRFKYQEDVQKYIKLAYRVAFPLELRLFNTVDDAPDADRLYELFAIVVHIGNGPYHGHYITIVKAGAGWLVFDDDVVDTIKETDLPRYFGDSNSGQAYVLYYQAVDLDLASLGVRPTHAQAASASTATPLAHPPAEPSREAVEAAGALAAAGAAAGLGSAAAQAQAHAGVGAGLGDPHSPALPPGLVPAEEGDSDTTASSDRAFPPTPAQLSTPTIPPAPHAHAHAGPGLTIKVPPHEHIVGVIPGGGAQAGVGSPPPVTTPGGSLGGFFHSLVPGAKVRAKESVPALPTLFSPSAGAGADAAPTQTPPSSHPHAHFSRSESVDTAAATRKVPGVGLRHPVGKVGRDTSEKERDGERKAGTGTWFKRKSFRHSASVGDDSLPTSASTSTSASLSTPPSWYKPASARQATVRRAPPEPPSMYNAPPVGLSHSKSLNAGASASARKTLSVPGDASEYDLQPASSASASISTGPPSVPPSPSAARYREREREREREKEREREPPSAFHLPPAMPPASASTTALPTPALSPRTPEHKRSAPALSASARQKQRSQSLDAHAPHDGGKAVPLPRPPVPPLPPLSPRTMGALPSPSPYSVSGGRTSGEKGKERGAPGRDGGEGEWERVEGDEFGELGPLPHVGNGSATVQGHGLGAATLSPAQVTSSTSTSSAGSASTTAASPPPSASNGAATMGRRASRKLSFSTPMLGFGKRDKEKDRERAERDREKAERKREKERLKASLDPLTSFSSTATTMSMSSRL